MFWKVQNIWIGSDKWGKKYEKQLCDTKVRQEGGGDVPVDRSENPPQSLEDIIVKQAVSLQPLENCGGTDTYTAAHGELPATAGGCVLKEAAVCRGRTRKPSLTSSLVEEYVQMYKSC